MIEVHKSISYGKGHNTNEKFLYINLMGFKDEIEQEIYYQKIQQLLKDSQGRIKVY